MQIPILGGYCLSRVVAVLAVAAFILVAAWPDSGQAQEPAPVRVVMPEPATAAATLRLTGTVTAEHRAGLSPRLSGLVAAVLVDAGDPVERGEVLLELDRELAEIALARAKAALAEARSNLAEAQRLQAESAQLVAQRHIAASEALGRDAAVRQNSAIVARLDADAREAAALLERHSLIAPFAGVISSKLAEAGEWVETGTAVLELVSTDDLRVDVQVPQERFAQIDAETPVSVSLAGSAASARDGRIVARVPVSDPGARTFLVRIRVDDGVAWMIPGMSAEAQFAIRGGERALAIPRDALLRGSDGLQRVWVVDEIDGESRAQERTVETGRALAESVEVLGGLDDRLPVVVRGNESLREGQPVRVIDGD